MNSHKTPFRVLQADDEEGNRFIFKEIPDEMDQEGFAQKACTPNSTIIDGITDRWGNYH